MSSYQQRDKIAPAFGQQAVYPMQTSDVEKGPPPYTEAVRSSPIIGGRVTTLSSPMNKHLQKQEEAPELYTLDVQTLAQLCPPPYYVAASGKDTLPAVRQQHNGAGAGGGAPEDSPDRQQIRNQQQPPPFEVVIVRQHGENGVENRVVLASPGGPISPTTSSSSTQRSSGDECSTTTVKRTPAELVLSACKCLTISVIMAALLFYLVVRVAASLTR